MSIWSIISKLKRSLHTVQYREQSVSIYTDSDRKPITQELCRIYEYRTHKSYRLLLILCLDDDSKAEELIQIESQKRPWLSKLGALEIALEEAMRVQGIKDKLL